MLNIPSTKNTGSYPKNSGCVAIDTYNSGQNKSIYFLAFFLFSKMYIKEKKVKENSFPYYSSHNFFRSSIRISLKVLDAMVE